MTHALREPLTTRNAAHCAWTDTSRGMSCEAASPGRSALVVGVAVAAYPALLRTRCLTWGATSDEINRQMPGDDLLPTEWRQAWRITRLTMCRPRQSLRRQEFPKQSFWHSEGCWTTPQSTRRTADSAVRELYQAYLVQLPGRGRA